MAGDRPRQLHMKFLALNVNTYLLRICFCLQVSPTYYILTAVASTDLLTMLAYLPYAIYFYCVATPEPDYQHRLVTDRRFTPTKCRPNQFLKSHILPWPKKRLVTFSWQSRFSPIRIRIIIHGEGYKRCIRKFVLFECFWCIICFFLLRCSCHVVSFDFPRYSYLTL